MNTALSQLESKLDIVFRDKKLLENVFIHRSYLNEHRDGPLSSNEKLEFLGDSVLSLATSIYLYRNYPELNEGLYTDIKAAVVRTESLAEAARIIGLGDIVYLSKGEELNLGRQNKNILADCFESLVAAIFLDQGFDSAYAFITSWLFKNNLKRIIDNKLYLSPKSRLQELLQAKHKALPVYEITSEHGPEHKKEFTITVIFEGKALGTGTGASKKEAEELAAKNALEKMP